MSMISKHFNLQERMNNLKAKAFSSEVRKLYDEYKGTVLKYNPSVTKISYRPMYGIVVGYNSIATALIVGLVIGNGWNNIKDTDVMYCSPCVFNGYAYCKPNGQLWSPVTDRSLKRQSVYTGHGYMF